MHSIIKDTLDYHASVIDGSQNLKHDNKRQRVKICSYSNRERCEWFSRPYKTEDEACFHHFALESKIKVASGRERITFFKQT